ncbi:MAG: zinc ABC transporter substrate-binding protein [Simkaniaceae bacterium]
MYKKIIFITSLLLFFGCSSHSAYALPLSKWMENNGKLKVLSTTAIIDNVVAEIGGEEIDHIPLIVGEIDPHSYELVKGDAEKLYFAELIFSNGLGLEHGASLQAVLKNQDNVVALGNSLSKEDLIEMNHIYDPHFWMDAGLMSKVIPLVVKALSEKKPEFADVFKSRGKRYQEELLDLDKRVLSIIESIPEKRRYLVTSHDAFNYFSRRYLSLEADDFEERFKAPEGLAPDGQISTHHIQEILDHLKVHNIETLFPESNVSRDSIKKIISSGKRLGLSIKIAEEPLYGDALGPKGSYIGMLEYNAEVIEKNLGKDS